MNEAFHPVEEWHGAIPDESVTFSTRQAKFLFDGPTLGFAEKEWVSLMQALDEF